MLPTVATHTPRNSRGTGGATHVLSDCGQGEASDAEAGTPGLADTCACTAHGKTVSIRAKRMALRRTLTATG